MGSQIKVLVVDDEDRIRRLLKMYLERENFLIEEASDGDEALQKALNNDPNVILLDLMMPGRSGIEVCRELREHKSTPIVILTAKGEEVSRVQGLEAGADDYIVKPFSPREVVLRVKAVLRRAQNQESTQETSSEIMSFSNVTIDKRAHRVLVDDQELNLTPKEYDLLTFLTKNAGCVFDRETLLKEVWRSDFMGDFRTIDTHIKRLREKLLDVSEKAAHSIVTVWGRGYKFDPPEE